LALILLLAFALSVHAYQRATHGSEVRLTAGLG
jgi:hypothetical protein